MKAQHRCVFLYSADSHTEHSNLPGEKDKATMEPIHLWVCGFILTFIVKSKAVTFYLIFESQGLDMVLTIPALSVWQKETEFWPSLNFKTAAINLKDKSVQGRRGRREKGNVEKFQLQSWMNNTVVKKKTASKTERLDAEGE